MIFLRVSPSPDWFEDIALEETADGIWSVYFYDVLLAGSMSATSSSMPEQVSPMLPVYSVTDLPGLFWVRSRYIGNTLVRGHG
jgi:hypothetical protein